jgi:nucleotide-binding universal stress UspA family protein
MTRTYLVATDGTETSKNAEDFVLETLDPEGVELVVTMVIEDLDEDQLEAVKEDVNLETLASKRKKEYESQLRERAERYEQEGFDVRTELRDGDAGEEICRLAEEIDADGIFVGRGGHSRLGEFFYGSVSHYIILNSNRSVIVSPSGAGDDEEETDYRVSRMDR